MPSVSVRPLARTLLACLALESLACREMDVSPPSADDESSSTGTAPVDESSSSTGASSSVDESSTSVAPTEDEGSSSSTGEPEPEQETFPGRMRRLLGREYVASIELMLGPEAASLATPPADIPQDGFDAVGAARLPPDGEAVAAYEASAARVAYRVVTQSPETLASRVPCILADPSNGCYDTVASVIGRIAFRRNMPASEVDALGDIGRAGREWADGNFLIGLRYELMAILQSPQFLYVVEVGESELDPEFGKHELTPMELATRLSLFLLGRIPDDVLIGRVLMGTFETEEQVAAVTEEMLADPRARATMQTFFDEFLRLRDLETAPKSAELFPEWTRELAEAMKEETRRMVEDIVFEQDGDYRDLFRSRETFVNALLAQHYGMQPPLGDPSAFVRTPWPASQHRAGYTSQGSFLTWQSGPTRNSPSRRGKYVRERLLCTLVPPPDPGTVLVLPEPDPGVTLKDLLVAHMEQPSCAGCHAQFDPIGFAFEHFDAIGGYRELDNGSPIEPSGEVAGIGAWDNAEELGDVLAEHPQLGRCLVDNLLRGGLGQVAGFGQTRSLDELADELATSGYRVQALIVRLVNHPLFRFVGEPE